MAHNITYLVRIGGKGTKHFATLEECYKYLDEGGYYDDDDRVIITELNHTLRLARKLN